MRTSSDSHPSHPMSGRDETEDWVTWPPWCSWWYIFEANCARSGAEECPSLQGWQTQLYYIHRLQSLCWRLSLKLIMCVNRRRITSAAAEQTTSSEEFKELITADLKPFIVWFLNIKTSRSSLVSVKKNWSATWNKTQIYSCSRNERSLTTSQFLFHLWIISLMSTSLASGVEILQKWPTWRS